jgi:hypothetical protein
MELKLHNLTEQEKDDLIGEIALARAEFWMEQ